MFPNCRHRDLDTGEPTHPAEYALADDAYAKLMTQLAAKNFAQANPELRDDILQLLRRSRRAGEDQERRSEVAKGQDALNQLKSAPPAVAEIERQAQ